jgi:hypothetical protein
VAQAEESLLCKCEVLRSNPHPTKKEKREKERTLPPGEKKNQRKA